MNFEDLLVIGTRCFKFPTQALLIQVQIVFVAGNIAELILHCFLRISFCFVRSGLGLVEK